MLHSIDKQFFFIFTLYKQTFEKKINYNRQTNQAKFLQMKQELEVEFEYF